jgi:CBS domain-containing protein
MNLGELAKVKGGPVETIDVNSKFDDAIAKMNDKHIGALMVVDDKGEVAGIISERDLLLVCSKCGDSRPVSALMTPKEKLISLGSKASIQDAMKIFTEKKIRHLPIIDDGKLVGIVSIGDAVKAMLEAIEQDNKYLNEYIMGQDV